MKISIVDWAVGSGDRRVEAFLKRPSVDPEAEKAARGILDRLVGGPGLRRGRRDPEHVYPGEVVDFWRVEEVREPRLLRLRAEMMLPGKAWLQFEAIPEGDGTRLVQTAYFVPTGFSGWAYWYGIYPLHSLIFSDLVEAVSRDAADLARDEAKSGVTAGPRAA